MIWTGPQWHRARLHSTLYLVLSSSVLRPLAPRHFTQKYLWAYENMRILEDSSAQKYLCAFWFEFTQGFMLIYAEWFSQSLIMIIINKKWFSFGNFLSQISFERSESVLRWFSASPVLRARTMVRANFGRFWMKFTFFAKKWKNICTFSPDCVYYT